MKRTLINSLLASEKCLNDVNAKGWIRTRRDSKDFCFIELNDGSCLKNIQIIAGRSLENYEDIKKLTTGSALAVNGKLVASKGGEPKAPGWYHNLKANPQVEINVGPKRFPVTARAVSNAAIPLETARFICAPPTGP